MHFDTLEFVALWSGGNNAVTVGDRSGPLGLWLTTAACTTLNSCLPAAACTRLRTSKEVGKLPVILLDADCPDEVMQVPWELMTLDGAPFGQLGLVVRHAVVRFDAGLRRTRLLCLNLFPRAEFDFPRRFQPLVEQERLSYQPLAAPELPPYYEDLVVLAHGDASLCISELHAAAYPNLAACLQFSEIIGASGPTTTFARCRDGNLCKRRSRSSRDGQLGRSLGGSS